jgi:hypothetical protein
MFHFGTLDVESLLNLSINLSALFVIAILIEKNFLF